MRCRKGRVEEGESKRGGERKVEERIIYIFFYIISFDFCHYVL